MIALTVTLATFMEVLDSSIANVALPHIAGGLGAGPDESTWVLTSYLVSNAIVLPMSGWLSTVIGRKRFYMTCVALFTVSSILCGFAPTLPLSDLLPHSARRGRRRHGTQRAGHSRRYLPSREDAGRRSRCTAWRLSWRRRSVRPWAVGSPTTTIGAGSSSSMCRSALLRCCCQKVVEDPPYLRGRCGKIKVDYIGLSLIVVGIGALQVVLDKGQQDDWFGSSFITTFFLLSVSAWCCCDLGVATPPTHS